MQKKKKAGWKISLKEVSRYKDILAPLSTYKYWFFKVIWNQSYHLEYKLLMLFKKKLQKSFTQQVIL